jgi:hypothetical protein
MSIKAGQIVLEYGVELNGLNQGNDKAKVKVLEFTQASINADKNRENSSDKANKNIVGHVTKTAAANEKLIRSYERQAALYGKTGTDKLAAQHELLTKRFGLEETQVKRLTAAYDKMVAAEKAGKGSGSGDRFSGIGESLKGIIENPGQGAQGALQGLLGTLGPVGIALASVTGAAIAAGVGIFEIVKSAGEGARELQNLSIRTGITIEQAEKLSIAAKLTGVDISALEQSSRLLSRALEDETGEGKAQAKALNDLGVATSNFNGTQREEGEVLLDVLNKLAQIPDTAKRVYESQQLLGKGAKVLQPMIVDLVKLHDTIETLSGGLHDGVNKQLLDADKAIRQLDVEWDIFKKNVAGGFAPVVIKIIRFFEDSGIETDDKGKKHVTDSLGGDLAQLLTGNLNVLGNYTTPKFPGLNPKHIGAPTDTQLNAPSIAAGDVLGNKIKAQHDATRSGLEESLKEQQKIEKENYALTQKANVGVEAKAEAQKKYNEALKQEEIIQLRIKAISDAKHEQSKLPDILKHYNDVQESPLVKLGNTYSSDIGHATNSKERDAITQAFTAARQRIIDEQRSKQEIEQIKFDQLMSEEGNKQRLIEANKFGSLITGNYPGGAIPISGKQQTQLSKDQIQRQGTSLELASTGSTGDKLAVAQKLYAFKQQELALDQKLEESDAQAITNETDRAGKLADIKTDFARRQFDAEADYENKLTEIRKSAPEKAYANTMEKLQSELGYLEKKAKLNSDDLQVQIQIQRTKDEILQTEINSNLQQNSAMAGVNAFFLKMQQQGTTTAQIISDAMNQIVDQTSANLAKIVTGQKPKNETYGQMFGKEFQGIGGSLVSSTLKSSMQKGLGALGIGGKADGSATNPWYVRSADKMPGSGGPGMNLGDMDMTPAGMGASNPSGLFSGGGSIGSLFSGTGLFSGAAAAGEEGAASAGPSIVSMLQSLPMLAGGGDVDAGSSYIVGDGGNGSGAEVFSPSQPGRITPLDKLGGGNTTHNHYSIDARGAELGVENRIYGVMAEMHAESIKQSVRVNAERDRRTVQGKR